MQPIIPINSLTNLDGEKLHKANHSDAVDNTESHSCWIERRAEEQRQKDHHDQKRIA